MESNVCLSCRFGSVKIEILVPETYDVQEFVTETQNFASDIIATVGQKPIHYSLRFDSEHYSDGLDFTVACSCILNIKRKECSKFNQKEEYCKVKHLVSRNTRLEEAGIEIRC